MSWRYLVKDGCRVDPEDGHSIPNIPAEPAIDSVQNEIHSLINAADQRYDSGDIDGALPMYQRAMAMYQESSSPRSVEVGAYHKTFAEILLSQNYLDDAENNFLQYISIELEHNAPQSARIAACEKQIGDLYLSVGQNMLALPHYLASLDIIFSLNPNGLEEADLCKQIQVVYHSQQEFELALGYAQRCLEIHARIAPNTSILAYSHNAMGFILYATCKMNEALEHFSKSLIIFDNFVDPHGLEVANCYHNIGDVKDSLGKLNEALGAYVAALEIRQRLTPGDESVAESHETIAELLTSQGHRKEAEQHIEKSQRLRTALQQRTSGGDVKET